jgi:hypothetical protein
MNNSVVSLAGCAKVGKDTFFKLMADLYPGAVRLSIGDIIRQDCAQLILDRFDIEVFNATPEQKEIIRPILAGYGKAQQDATKGKYFTDILDVTIESLRDDKKYFILTDCRYMNEVEWLRSKNGVLVYITRVNKNGEDIIPANEFEADNDISLRLAADYRIKWHTRDNKEYLIPFAVDFHKWLNTRTTKILN